jgi:phage terminase large subunit-like protein
MTLTEELIQYCNECISSKFTCQKHKWACERFKRDLERAGSDSFPYVFVEANAERFFEWMRLFKHTKGPLAGTIKEPEPIEKFIFGQIYGWVHRDTRFRRFRTAYWQVARKNAKSQDLAIVGTYEMSAFGEPCAEVYVAATKKEQTRYVWEEADLIIRRCDMLRDRFKTSYGTIKHEKSSSVFARMSEEDKKKGDGSNPQCGIIDEYHAHETDEYYNILSSGMKTRTQPLLIIITTAGFDLNHPCYRDEYHYVSKILDPDSPIENDRYFAMVNELDKNNTTENITFDGKEVAPGDLIDDIKNESVWIKANPILATTREGLDSIRAELQIALDKPEKMRDFLTKTMDVWVNQREAGYMDMAKWGACVGKIPDMRGKSCYIGLDLSAKIDLTSVTFEFPHDDKYYVHSHSFMPSEKLEEKRKTDRVPYDQWHRAGWITATPGAVVDYRAVKAYAIEMAEKNGWHVEEICIDPWGSVQIAGDLTDEGYTVVDIVQGIKTLSEPTKDFRDMVYSGRVVHDGNPVLTWAMGNAVVDAVDRNANMILTKKKSKERIDPVAATINAHVRAMVKAENAVYNRRGMRSLSD